MLVNAAGITSPNSTMKYQQKVWNLSKVNDEDTRGTSMFRNVSISMWSFWRIQMYANLFQHLSFHNLFYLNHSEVRNGAKYVLPKVTRSTKLQGTQRFPELGFRRTDFRVPENLISPALGYTEKNYALPFYRCHVSGFADDFRDSCIKQDCELIYFQFYFYCVQIYSVHKCRHLVLILLSLQI